VYIFDNSQENGLKCIYELKSQSDLTKKDYENEKKLNENAVSSLPLNKLLVNERIIQFAKGKEHILMLTEQTRKIFSFGIGLKGQLGHGVIENLFQPVEIKYFTTKINKIAAGNFILRWFK
jgi:alpha-tubulin suppressor-like RCC1 family protein